MNGHTAKRLRRRTSEIMKEIHGPKPKNLDKHVKRAWKMISRNVRCDKAIRNINVKTMNEL